MPSQIDDLWPSTFGGDTTAAPSSPVHILRQQGVQLGRRTRNFVLGKVSSHLLEDKTFEHVFALSAPVIGFEQPVLRVHHGFGLYPARIAVDPVLLPAGRPSETGHEAASRDEFVATLREIFGSEEMKAVVSSLLEQEPPPREAKIW